MKTLKIFLMAVVLLFVSSCSQDKMDEINKDVNNALSMSAQSEIPDVILKSAFETTATDIAWYATVYIEHSAGTWAQSNDADKRIGQTAATLFNNNWNSLYNVLMILDDMIKKTSPGGGEENPYARGIAQILTAYNLAVLTDMWGEVPWTEALKGSANLQPKYDKQSAIYPVIQQYLDDGIATLNTVTTFSTTGDYIYGGSSSTAIAKWKKAAYSLKARYYLRLTKVDGTASAKALTALANGFTGNADNLVFAKYEESATGENPWYQFLNDRTHLSVSKTLFDIMNARNDTLRMAAYFTQVGGDYEPAENGNSTESQGGLYSISLITENGATAATPMMTYHELKFIEAEAKQRTGDATWKAALQAAIEANFIFHGLTLAAGTAYYNAEVATRLTAGNELKEILIQKYIAFYEYEAIEAYNDYRRVTTYLTLNNPYNLTSSGGFVWRFPYPDSETASNSANIPTINVFTSKVWWAGGTEN
jgi:hypothetical protein